MGFATFLESMFEDGRVTVDEPTEILASDREAARTVLAEAEQIIRSDAPAGLPAFDLEVALWAAEKLYRAAQFFVSRDVNSEFIEAALSAPRPAGEDAACHYSIDVCFRYIYDVLRLSESLSASDPLNEQLHKLVRDWPLSAVGVTRGDGTRLRQVLDDESLRVLYADRIIERSDREAMSEPQTAEAIKAIIGAFPDLVPAFSQPVPLPGPESSAPDGSLNNPQRSDS